MSPLELSPLFGPLGTSLLFILQTRGILNLIQGCDQYELIFSGLSMHLKGSVSNFWVFKVLHSSETTLRITKPSRTRFLTQRMYFRRQSCLNIAWHGFECLPSSIIREKSPPKKRRAITSSMSLYTWQPRYTALCGRTLHSFPGPTKLGSPYSSSTTKPRLRQTRLISTQN